jgi:hypothetical protein
VSRRRSSLRAFVWFALAVVVITMLAAAEALVRHSLGQVAVVVLLPVAGYVLGRWQGSRRGRPRQLDTRPARERAADELARLRALVADLEGAAGRPAEAIVASYRAIQRRYGGPR